MIKLCSRDIEVRGVDVAQMDLQVQKVILVNLGHQGLWGKEALRGLKELEDFQVQWDLLDLMENQVCQDPLVNEGQW